MAASKGDGGDLDGIWTAGGRLGGRFALVEPLVVAGPWAATDEVRGGTVIIERFSVEALTESLRRRLVQLALADLPVAVPVVAVGSDGGDGWIATPVTGHVRPFAPGRAVGWDAVRDAALSLLETLARLHGVGLVHGAVGPASVVQTEDHGISLLGLGAVARVGPVRAPELAQGPLADEALDPRVDLFAVGAMLYAALAGRYPPEGVPDDWPVPLHLLAPAVPREVAAAVRDLLAPDPADRTPSAEAALRRMLRAPPGDPPLPLLGDRHVIDAIVLAVRSRQSVDVTGESGVGRTRCLTEAASRLARENVSVRRCVQGRRLFQSLEPVVGALDGMGVEGVQDARVEVERRLRMMLRNGTAVFADDFHRLDRWTRALLVSIRGQGAVVRGLGDLEDDDSDSLELRPLVEDDLRRLVDGTDRVLHLREDAAHELWRRSGGLPGRVAAQSAAWVRAGLGRRERGRLVVDREALDRLRAGLRVLPDEGPDASEDSGLAPSARELLAWVQFGGGCVTTAALATLTGRKRRELTVELSWLAEQGLLAVEDDGRMTALAVVGLPTTDGGRGQAPIHRQLASVLPPGSPGRLAHVVAGWQDDGLVNEGVSEVRALIDGGRPRSAMNVLRALELLAPRDRTLARLWAEAALASGDTVDLAEARAAVVAAGAEPMLGTLLASVGDLAAGADPSEVLLRVDAQRPSLDPWSERCRIEARVACARQVGPVALARVGREAADAVAALDEPGLGWLCDAWLAEAAAAEGRFSEAANRFSAAAEAAPTRHARLTALVGAARSLVAAGESNEALEVAADLIDEGKHHRIVEAELWGRLVEREAGLLVGVADEADSDLVDVAVLLAPEAAGRAALVEACVAFRGGRLSKVAELARMAERHAGGEPSAVLAGALRMTASPRSGDDAHAVAAAAAQCADPVMGLEALGLLARAGQLGGDWRGVVERLAAALPPGAGNDPGWLMTINEAVQAIERVSARAR